MEDNSLEYRAISGKIQAIADNVNQQLLGFREILNLKFELISKDITHIRIQLEDLTKKVQLLDIQVEDLKTIKSNIREIEVKLIEVERKTNSTRCGINYETITNNKRELDSLKKIVEKIETETEETRFLTKNPNILKYSVIGIVVMFLIGFATIYMKLSGLF